MKIIIISFFLFLTFHVYSSPRAANRVLDEGKYLYRLEKASWYGTDDFLERFPHKRNIIGGYLSYQNDDGNVINIFYSREDPTQIIVRYYFDKSPSINPIEIDTINSLASSLETELIQMRMEAINRVSSNVDNIYTFYENTNLNFIPVIYNRQRKVFILTAPQVDNTVLIGNDYLLTFDRKNRVKKEEKLHNSLLEFPYSSGDPDNKIKSTHHSHVLSAIITSTDICTLLLYKDLVEWRTHYVISSKYVSIFNLDNSSLVIMTRKAWNKISNN